MTTVMALFLRIIGPFGGFYYKLLFDTIIV